MSLHLAGRGTGGGGQCYRDDCASMYWFSVLCIAVEIETLFADYVTTGEHVYDDQERAKYRTLRDTL